MAALTRHGVPRGSSVGGSGGSHLVGSVGPTAFQPTSYVNVGGAAKAIQAFTNVSGTKATPHYINVAGVPKQVA